MAAKRQGIEKWIASAFFNLHPQTDPPALILTCFNRYQDSSQAMGASILTASFVLSNSPALALLPYLLGIPMLTTQPWQSTMPR